jgi:hypothetical protein
MLQQVVRKLYLLARAANKIRIADALARGNPNPLGTYLKNRLLFRIFGRFLR